MDPKKSGYNYDFNVVYNHAESRLSTTDDTKTSLEFTKFFVKKMEGFGLKKCYYYDRDAMPGRNKFKELFRIVESSKWTVVIFTNGFAKNCWAIYCQQSSFNNLLKKEKGERLIAVGVGVDEIPCEHGIQQQAWFKGNKDDWESEEAAAEWERLRRVLCQDTDQFPTQEHDGLPRTLCDMPITQETDTSSKSYFQQVLQRCNTTLIDHLDSRETLDSMYTDGMLTQRQNTDISNESKPSEKTREIIRILSCKDEAGYEKFKNILKQTGQDYVHGELLRVETEVKAESLLPATQNVERQMQVPEARVEVPSVSTFSTSASSQSTNLSSPVPTGPTVSVPRRPSPCPPTEQHTGSCFQEQSYSQTQTSGAQHQAQRQQATHNQPREVDNGAETSASTSKSLQVDGANSMTEATSDSVTAGTTNKPDLSVSENFGAPQSTTPASQSFTPPTGSSVSTAAPQAVDFDTIDAETSTSNPDLQNETDENLENRIESCSEIESITGAIEAVDIRDLSMDQAPLSLQPGNKPASDRFSDSGYSSPGDSIRSAASDFALKSDGKSSEIRTEQPMEKVSDGVPGEIGLVESNDVVIDIAEGGDTQGFEVQGEETIRNDIASINVASRTTANNTAASNPTASNIAARNDAVINTVDGGDRQDLEVHRKEAVSNYAASIHVAGQNAGGNNLASGITASLDASGDNTSKSEKTDEARESKRMGPEGEEANVEDVHQKIQEAPIEKVEISNKLQAVKAMLKDETEAPVSDSKLTSTPSTSDHTRDNEHQPLSLTSNLLSSTLRFYRWVQQSECAFSSWE